MSSARRFLSAAFLLGSLTVRGDNTEQTPTLVEQVCDEYLSSHGPAKPAPTPAAEEKTLGQNLRKLFFGKKFTPPVAKMGPREEYELAFQAAPLRLIVGQQAIDFTSMKKLEFYRGGENPQAHLAGRFFKHVKSRNGMCRAVSMLAQPMENATELAQRRNRIRELAQNSQLLGKASRACAQMAQAESSFLMSFRPEEEGAKTAYDQVYFGTVLNKALAGGNQNTTALEAKTQLWNLLTVLSIPYVSYPGSTYIGGWVARKIAPEYFPASHATDSVKNTLEWLDPRNIFDGKRPALIRSMFGAIHVFFAWSTFRCCSEAKTRYDICRHLQGKMIGVADYLRGMKQLYRVAKSNTVLCKTPSMGALRQVVSSSGKRSAQFNKLIELLDTSTFTGTPSVFSLMGRVLAAHELMKEAKAEFADALRAAGELETYVGLAQLVRKHAASDARYCFVDFVKGEPVIEARGCWNPFVNPMHAVLNNVTFGSNGMRGMILTGPNTGGKSTLIKGLMIDVLLAQTFGIAAAQSFTMTPCSKFHCHMNIADDTAGGVSLFKAEVLRARELIAALRALPADKVAFVIVDEIFTATSPDQAEKLSYEFIKQVAAFPNCFFIDATHFAKVTEVAGENSGCKNFHMEALTDASGAVTQYTYKLKDGISNVKNAGQVAQEGGAVDSLFDAMA